jgi:hypothetical protein
LGDAPCLDIDVLHQIPRIFAIAEQALDVAHKRRLRQVKDTREGWRRETMALGLCSHLPSIEAKSPTIWFIH